MQWQKKGWGRVIRVVAFPTTAEQDINETGPVQISCATSHTKSSGDCRVQLYSRTMETTKEQKWKLQSAISLWESRTQLSSVVRHGIAHENRLNLLVLQLSMPSKGRHESDSKRCMFLILAWKHVLMWQQYCLNDILKQPVDSNKTTISLFLLTTILALAPIAIRFQHVYPAKLKRDTAPVMDSKILSSPHCLIMHKNNKVCRGKN